MKITHILFAFNTGGAENMLIDIMKEQCELGHDIQLIIINDNIDVGLLANIDTRISIIKINRQKGSANLFSFLKLYLVLYLNKQDVVHCHNIWIGKALQFYYRKKIITIHATGEYIEELKFYDKIISISKAVHDDLLLDGNCKSTIVHNGVDSKSILIKEHECGTKSIKLIQVSRLVHETKGQDLLIKAIHRLKKNTPEYDIHVTFIGSGPSEEYLKSLVIDLDIDKDVEFLGLREKAYIYEHLRDYDILIQPSRFEGFGLTIVEAMAAKVAVLVSNVEGPMEVIENGKLGEYFSNENIDDLSKKIYFMIDSPNDSKVELAYHFTKNNYDIQNTVKEYVKIYQKTINNEL